MVSDPDEQAMREYVSALWWQDWDNPEDEAYETWEPPSFGSLPA